MEGIGVQSNAILGKTSMRLGHPVESRNTIALLKFKYALADAFYDACDVIPGVVRKPFSHLPVLYIASALAICELKLFLPLGSIQTR